MSRADDLLNNVQKAVGDKPFLLLAGAGDLVSEKLRELPDALNAWQEENRDFPMRAAGALVGSAFRANLKVGELYDELTRRGHDVMAKMRGDEVFAEEDEPFVREPFMPAPVARATAKKTPAKATAKNAAPAKVAAKRAAATGKSATKRASVANVGTKNSVPKKASVKRSAPAR